MGGLKGDLLPRIVTEPPGPRSRELAERLRRVESPNVTFIGDHFPIFWREARGANVMDVDGNIYIDLTAAFAVAATGHANARVVDAVRSQLALLPHGMGDVHPPEIKVLLLERLAAIAPGDLSQTILASAGAEAIEAALKTARLASGRPGVLAFTGGYHGLTYGALSATDGSPFRAPFLDQLGLPVHRLPFPDPYRPASEYEAGGDIPGEALTRVERALETPEHRIGAIIVEPIQGRGGVVLPPPGFLAGLRQLADARGVVLIFDEIYTGMGRTGRWFACQHEGVVPDLLCVGKALTGALPFSACIGRPEVMAAWPPNTGAAIHTSTFLGHPLACAAALAQIQEIESSGLVDRARRLGTDTLNGLREWEALVPGVGNARGRGLMIGLDLVARGTTRPDPTRARRMVDAALRKGLIILQAGAEANVLAITPPLNIASRQLEHAVGILQGLLTEA